MMGLYNKKVYNGYIFWDIQNTSITEKKSHNDSTGHDQIAGSWLSYRHLMVAKRFTFSAENMTP